MAKLKFNGHINVLVHVVLAENYDKIYNNTKGYTEM